MRGRSRCGAQGEARLYVAFAGLLRQLRAEARLTQEELAEAAGLCPRSVSDLERGIKSSSSARNRRTSLTPVHDGLPHAGRPCRHSG
jgi:DNA-binding XRE family transcriptional regulator